ncbi:Delta(3,5)-Delta(2,4)-dienoyl-CoA isomerase, mitochondrial-like [Oopsacas minuta]|uniref:Delta(3,5)-Delta(2,4)-dienoyl-CoA isomerase, mitochondrial n=1 Tax=Oopsacas minuta TaxID=111878 RepID=A0AAV7KMQ1_9METZ|nr:Delta(3,5)-Delta(2,4)-dienoyl-CoA isomerase, mitochondrial-like [Oopsacas minuta]
MTSLVCTNRSPIGRYNSSCRFQEIYSMLLRTFRSTIPAVKRMYSQIAAYDKYTTLKVTAPSEYVCHVELNRPDSLNSMNKQFFTDLRQCFEQISSDSSIRCVMLSGAGRFFTSGLDLKDAALLTSDQPDVGRKGLALLRGSITPFQESISSLEKCSKPVVCAIHSGCVGGGVDLVTAGDIRLATSDAYFQIKEIDIGLAADIGTLQRFQKVIGNDSIFRELAYTCRKLFADEAFKIGLISSIFVNKEEMMKFALETCTIIASKSPIAIQTSKKSINYSRDHSVKEGLEHVAAWNMTMLQSEDLIKAVMAAVNKEKPVFSKL